MKHDRIRTGRGQVDSPAKKLVRLDVFETACRLLREKFFAGMHLGLSSKEAGDYGTLTGLGVEARNIVMCDLDEEAVTAARCRWHPDITVVHGDILDVVKEGVYSAVPWAMINYDTCSPLRDNTDSVVHELANNIMDHGLLCCWFLAGRERGGTMDNIVAMEGLVRDSLSNRSFKSLKIPKDILEDRLPYIARALLMESNLNVGLMRNRCHSRLIRIWTYMSNDPVEGKIGSPMVVVMCQVRGGKPKTTQAPLEENLGPAIMHPHFIVTGDCRKRLGQKAMELLNDGKPAGLLLNSRNSESAWRAHATRGTYG